MSNGVKDNIMNIATWKRGLYMLLCTIFCSVAELVLFALVIIQFLF